MPRPKWKKPRSHKHSEHCILTLFNCPSPSASRSCKMFINKHPYLPFFQLPVSFSALKPACIKGCTTSELCHWTQCLTTQLLCSSCLYPCTSDACTNKLCPLVSTLLNCEVVSDPKSKVLGCPMFRACPKCHNLIMHEKGCKFVKCTSCKHTFCFICLQDDCSKDPAHYWSLTCTKQRAERQRFFTPQS